MASQVAAAILKQLRASFGVRIREAQADDPATGTKLWTLTATAKSGELWTSRHEDHYRAACGLAELMGRSRPAIVSSRLEPTSRQLASRRSVGPE